MMKSDLYLRQSVSLLILIVMALFLNGCQASPDLPTRLPTAALPTPAATDTPPIPPTRTPNPTPTPIPSPTPVFATRTATPPPTPSGPAVNITTPGINTDVIIGTELVVSGLGKILNSQTLSVTLVSATGHRLADAEAAMGDFNSWQVNLDVPQSVSGPAQLQATIWDEEGTLIALDVHAVNLVLDTNTTDSYMALFRPVTGQQAVAGYNLFFDGRAQLPANNAIHISIWDENCQNQLARQTFTLRGSSYWHGFLIIPRNITGPICAVADFGEPGEEDWREAQVLIDVLPASDENAKGVIIGRPAPGDTLVAGESVFIRGTAYNAPDNEVVVSIVLENGRILTEGIATADLFGYWEITLFLPIDASGPAMINVSIGIAGEDDYAQSQNLVTIEPAE